jgi:hypothetical protein
LLPLLAIVAFELVQARSAQKLAGADPAAGPMRGGLGLFRPVGLLLFAVVGFTWYLVVIQRHPGWLDYFLGHEVYARIATAELKRFPEWYGPLVVYLPTLVAGSIPWLVMALIGIRKRAWRDMPADLRFLWIWFALPLLIFCLARSRLPLYVLPLFAPLALLLGKRLATRQWWWSAPWLLLLWVALLLGVKFWAANYVTDKDGRVFAQQLMPMLPGQPRELLFVEDMTRNGLNLYLDTDIERISFKPQPTRMSDSS